MLKLAGRKKIENKSNDITKFSKEQFLQSKRFYENRDILNVILDDDKNYSFDEVEEILKTFLESEV